MNNPLISIIIPTYDRAHLISETLDSISAQTYTNWECIIVDDGSTDNTAEILKKYINEDSRFRYYNRPENRPKGGNACRNYGFELSNGNFIKWFDSDDLMRSTFLDIQLKIMLQNVNLDFCAAFCDTFSTEGINSSNGQNPKIFQYSVDILSDFLYEKIFFKTPSPLWRKSFLTKKKLFDEEIFRGQEADFNFRRLLEGAKFVYTVEKLFLVRRGHKSISSTAKNDIRSFESRFIYFQNIFQNINFCFKDEFQKTQAKKYLLYRQSGLYANLRYSTKNKMYYSKMIVNIRQTKMNFLERVRILLGIFLIRNFGIGYRIVKISKFSEIP